MKPTFVCFLVSHTPLVCHGPWPCAAASLLSFPSSPLSPCTASRPRAIVVNFPSHCRGSFLAFGQCALRRWAADIICRLHHISVRSSPSGYIGRALAWLRPLFVNVPLRPLFVAVFRPTRSPLRIASLASLLCLSLSVSGTPWHSPHTTCRSVACTAALPVPVL